MTVFVVHPVKEDLEPALRFGELRYITSGYVHADELDNEEIPDDKKKLMQHAADDFDPGIDFLLIAGDHLQLVQFVAILARDLSMSGFRVLRYDREAKGYFPVHIQP